MTCFQNLSSIFLSSLLCSDSFALCRKKLIFLFFCFQDFIHNHPECILVDPLENVSKLMSRYDQYIKVQEMELSSPGRFWDVNYLRFVLVISWIFEEKNTFSYGVWFVFFELNFVHLWKVFKIGVKWFCGDREINK